MNKKQLLNKDVTSVILTYLEGDNKYTDICEKMRFNLRMPLPTSERFMFIKYYQIK